MKREWLGDQQKIITKKQYKFFHFENHIQFKLVIWILTDLQNCEIFVSAYAITISLGQETADLQFKMMVNLPQL